MISIEQLQEDFHNARVEGERLLAAGKTTWDEHVADMMGYEARLRRMGASL